MAEFYSSCEEGTYDDYSIVPSRNFEKRLEAVCSFEELSQLHHFDEIRKQEGLSPEEQKMAEFNYFDELDRLAEAHLRIIDSRSQVDLTPRGSFGNIPIVASNMNSVSGQVMAEAMAWMGGSVALPQDLSSDETIKIIEYLKSRNIDYQSPLKVSRETSIGNLEDMLNHVEFETAIVVDNGGDIVGIVNREDILDEDNSVTVQEVMKREFLSAQAGISHTDALVLMDEAGVDFFTILEGEKIVGCLSKKAAAWRHLGNKPHVGLDGQGLASLVTVSINGNSLERVMEYVRLGVNGIIIDTAHFDRGIDNGRLLRQVRKIIDKSGKDIKLIAGNVVTEEAVKYILAYGADFVKVGIGPGATCETRIKAGVGRPQMAAVLACASEAKRLGGNIWADGGIKYPRDLSLALAGGASHGMMGSLLAPTFASAAIKHRDVNGLYVGHGGMASACSNKNRTEKYKKRNPDIIAQETLGFVTEGIDPEKIYLDPKKSSVFDIVKLVTDGTRSACTYVGANDLVQFPNFARLVRQTQSGRQEAEPQFGKGTY